jgi:hypothetical protein
MIWNLCSSATVAVTYFCFFVLQVELLPEFDFLPTASIFFIPAGVKFLSVLILRWWGVGGVLVGRILVQLYLGEEISLFHDSMELLLWLVVPYLCLMGYMQVKEIQPSLENLTTYHVVVLSLIFSFTSSLGTQLLDFVSGYQMQVGLPKAIWAMTVGDFTGILLILFLVASINKMLRSRQRI